MLCLQRQPLVGSSQMWAFKAVGSVLPEILYLGPGWVALLARASYRYTKVVGSIPGQDTYKNPPMNAKTSGTTNPSFSLPVSKINK